MDELQKPRLVRVAQQTLAFCTHDYCPYGPGQLGPDSCSPYEYGPAQSGPYESRSREFGPRVESRALCQLAYARVAICQLELPAAVAPVKQLSHHPNRAATMFHPFQVEQFLSEHEELAHYNFSEELKPCGRALQIYMRMRMPRMCSSRLAHQRPID